MSNGGDGLNYTFHCNAIAWEFRCLLLVSVAGPAMAIKSFRGALAQGKPTFNWDGPDDAPGQCQYGMARDGFGYHFSKPTKLGYGTWQIMAWSGRPGFLPNGEAESLWQHFCKHHSTPLLWDWMGYLMQRLTEAKRLFTPDAFGCAPVISTAADVDLDKIVSAGIRAGELKLPAHHPYLHPERTNP